MKLNVDKQVRMNNTDDRQNIKLQNVNKLIEEGLKMTPAERAGLKVGDKIRVLGNFSMFKEGEIIEFKDDDGSENPWFWNEDKSDHSPFSFADIKWEKYNMNKEFKAMKFWIGDDPELSKRVHKLLKGLGYGYKMVESRIEEKAVMLVTTEDGAMW